MRGVPSGRSRGQLLGYAAACFSTDRGLALSALFVSSMRSRSRERFAPLASLAGDLQAVQYWYHRSRLLLNEKHHMFLNTPYEISTD